MRALARRTGIYGRGARPLLLRVLSPDRLSSMLRGPFSPANVPEKFETSRLTDTVEPSHGRRTRSTQGANESEVARAYPVVALGPTRSNLLRPGYGMSVLSSSR